MSVLGRGDDGGCADSLCGVASGRGRVAGTVTAD